MGKFLATASAKEQVLYGKSGAVAEEVLSGIRTVTAYSAERFEIQRYVKSLQEGLAVAKKKGIIGC